MSEPIQKIFSQIDKNADGFISFSDLESSPYYAGFFQKHPKIIQCFLPLQDKMNLKNFQLLVNSHRMKLHDLAKAKFRISQSLDKSQVNKFLSETGSKVKKNYIRLKALKNQSAAKHSIQVCFGLDKKHQAHNINEIKSIFGQFQPHFFVLLKFKTNKNGEEIAQKLQNCVQELLDLSQSLFAELKAFLTTIKIKTKFFNGFIYLIVKIASEFVDGIRVFLKQMTQTAFPQSTFKIKIKISTDLSHFLKQNFDYSINGGDIKIEFKTDQATISKILQITRDNLKQRAKESPLKLIYALLFEQLQFSAQHDTLGQAIQSFFVSQAPKVSPYMIAQNLKQMNLKQTLGQFFEQIPELIDTLRNNCEFKCKLSLYLQDFFLNLDADMANTNAFDWL